MPFNSREYEWNDLSLSVGGVELTGFRAVKYTSKDEKEVLYAKGGKPRSIQSGNESFEGEITLLQSEYDALVKAAPGKNIKKLQMDAIVSYGNPTAGNTLSTDKIVGLMITESAKELKQGDKFMEINLPFIALDIKEQI